MYNMLVLHICGKSPIQCVRIRMMAAGGELLTCNLLAVLSLQITEMTVEVRRAPTSLQASMKRKVDAYSDSVKELRTKLVSVGEEL